MQISLQSRAENFLFDQNSNRNETSNDNSDDDDLRKRKPTCTFFHFIYYFSIQLWVAVTLIQSGRTHSFRIKLTSSNCTETVIWKGLSFGIKNNVNIFSLLACCAAKFISFLFYLLTSFLVERLMRCQVSALSRIRETLTQLTGG